MPFCSRPVPSPEPHLRTGGTRVAITRVAALLAAFAATALAPGGQPGRPARADDDPRIDPDSGRHLAHWATGPRCDFLHMRLEIEIPDMEVPRLEAVQTLRVRGVGQDLPSLRLDAQGLQIGSVRVDGQDARFEHAAGVLVIHLPAEPLRRGVESAVEIRYAAEYPVADGLGLNWSVGDPGGDSATDRFAQIHSQGQAENNRRWFPCHDQPNERLATTLVVSVPGAYTVISNGRLAEKAQRDDGLVTWVYDQARPHPAYLVSLVVGVFDAVELAGPGIDAPTDIPMTVYGPVGTAENLERVFEGTPAMLAFFERWLDEAYPWDRYDQVCVRNFHSGGMENTAATTLYEDAARSTRAVQEDLISHELIHMWFGDLITCRTWDHLWLNEGWATYGEVLWREEQARALAEADGLAPEDVVAEGRAAMLEYMLQLMRVQRRFNRSAAPHDPGLVSNLYRDPETVFDRSDDPYNKGAAVLHMLRMTLGDDLFQRGTRLYVDRHKDGLVETDDLRRCYEEVSGRSLERFFTQWALRPGLPRLSITLEWIEEDRHLLATVEQTQRIDADNPAYALDLPLHITVGRRDIVTSIRADERLEQVRIPLDAAPAGVAVDPMLSVFADTRVEKELAWWRHELEAGPTVVARIRAAEAIAGHAEADAADAVRLVRLAGDGAAPASLRRAAGQGAAALAVRGLASGLMPVAIHTGSTHLGRSSAGPSRPGQEAGL